MSGAQAASTQLAGNGAVDGYMTQSNNSFFVSVNNMYSPFALDTAQVGSELTLSSSSQSVEIDRAGDMLNRIFVRITGPGCFNITADNNILVPESEYASNALGEATGIDTKTFTSNGTGSASIYSKHDACARYCNFAPCALIKLAELKIGNAYVDQINARAILIHNQLYVNDALLTPQSLNVGTPNERARMAQQPVEWNVLLPFYFNDRASHAFALIQTQFNKCMLNLTFNDVADAIENRSDRFSTFKTVVGGVDQAIKTRKISTAIELASGTVTQDLPALADFKARVYVQYCYLGEAERRARVGMTQDVLFLQHQYAESFISLTSSTTKVTQNIDFNFPCAAVHVTPQSSYRKAAGQLNDCRGFPEVHSCTKETPEGHPQHLLKSFHLKFNNNGRNSAEDSALYFTEMQPRMHADSVPGASVRTHNHIYLYSFALGNPYVEGASGSANFSRISRITSTVEAADNAFTNDTTAAAKENQSIVCDLNALSYNVLHYAGGQATVTFAS